MSPHLGHEARSFPISAANIISSLIFGDNCKSDPQVAHLPIPSGRGITYCKLDLVVLTGFEDIWPATYSVEIKESRSAGPNQTDNYQTGVEPL